MTFTSYISSETSVCGYMLVLKSKDSERFLIFQGSEQGSVMKLATTVTLYRPPIQFGRCATARQYWYQDFCLRPAVHRHPGELNKFTDLKITDRLVLPEIFTF